MNISCSPFVSSFVVVPVLLFGDPRPVIITKSFQFFFNLNLFIII